MLEIGLQWWKRSDLKRVAATGSILCVQERERDGVQDKLWVSAVGGCYL